MVGVAGEQRQIEGSRTGTGFRGSRNCQGLALFNPTSSIISGNKIEFVEQIEGWGMERRAA